MPLATLLLGTAWAPLTRDMTPRVERKYRVTVREKGGDEFTYRLRLKTVEVKPNKLAKGEIQLDLLLTDYRGTLSGQKVNLKFLGSGLMPIDASGLPIGINAAGPQGPIWMPLVALAFPGGEEGGFDLVGTQIGGGMRVEGKGTFTRKDDKPHVDLDAGVVRPDAKVGKLTFSTDLDKKGWPQKSEGTFVSADGTFHFALDRA